MWDRSSGLFLCCNFKIAVSLGGGDRTFGSVTISNAEPASSVCCQIAVSLAGGEPTFGSVTISNAGPASSVCSSASRSDVGNRLVVVIGWTNDACYDGGSDSCLKQISYG